MFDYRKYMGLALEQAKKSGLLGEIPVGALIVDQENNIISAAHNLVESESDVTNHAEIIVIREAQKKLKSKSLQGCSLYVTLEPCAMCASAISHSRISKLIFGAYDEKQGAVENGARIYQTSSALWKPEVIGGIMQEECSKILKEFFLTLR